MKGLTTHELAQMLLEQPNQPVYTCDYAGNDGELTMYPVSCVDSKIIQDGTIICTPGDGIPYSQFVPFDLMDAISDRTAAEIREAEDKCIIELLKKSKEEIRLGHTYSHNDSLARLDEMRVGV